VGVRTFADLRLSDPDSSLAEYQCHALVVHASDLTRRVLVRLPWDYDQYGQVVDKQLVVDAVRASISIPFYFRPVQVNTGTGAATWVDGGLLSTFPITVFDRTDGAPERWPTWGVKLSGEPRDGRPGQSVGSPDATPKSAPQSHARANEEKICSQWINRRRFASSRGGARTAVELLCRQARRTASQREGHGRTSASAATPTATPPPGGTSP
jgi:NTE family protein